MLFFHLHLFILPVASCDRLECVCITSAYYKSRCLNIFDDAFRQRRLKLTGMYKQTAFLDHTFTLASTHSFPCLKSGLFGWVSRHFSNLDNWLMIKFRFSVAYPYLNACRRVSSVSSMTSWSPIFLILTRAPVSRIFSIACAKSNIWISKQGTEPIYLHVVRPIVKPYPYQNTLTPGHDAHY